MGPGAVSDPRERLEPEGVRPRDGTGVGIIGFGDVDEGGVAGGPVARKGYGVRLPTLTKRAPVNYVSDSARARVHVQ